MSIAGQRCRVKPKLDLPVATLAHDGSPQAPAAAFSIGKATSRLPSLRNSHKDMFMSFRSM
jgi:hypothetical protein